MGTFSKIIDFLNRRFSKTYTNDTPSLSTINVLLFTK